MVKDNSVDVVPYLMQDEKIGQIFKDALSIEACKYMFADGKLLGEKYREYKKLALRNGLSFCEAIENFAEWLDENTRLLSSGDSPIGDKELVIDFLKAKEMIKRKGSRVEENSSKMRKATILASRVAERIDRSLLSRANFECATYDERSQQVSDMIAHENVDEIRSSGATEYFFSDIIRHRFLAESSGEIARNMGDTDNEYANQYKDFAETMKQQYAKDEQVKKEDEAREEEPKYVEFGEKHPHVISDSKLQKMMKPYNVKALGKWFEKLLDSIDHVLVRIQNVDKTM